MEEKTNKKLEEISKSLKENQEKAIKQMNKTIQDLKTEIERQKKPEETIEMEIMRKQSGTTNASINSRIQEMEENLSTVKDTIEEIDSQVKENFKFNKS